VKSGDLVFNIGANVGVYSEIFASLGAHMIAVELLPENVVIFQHCATKIESASSRRLWGHRSEPKSFAGRSRIGVHPCRASGLTLPMHTIKTKVFLALDSTRSSFHNDFGYPLANLWASRFY
jgi:hypothetical protein